MKWWQYRARSHPGRLAARLVKYREGQIMLESKKEKGQETEVWRGAIEEIIPVRTTVHFHLHWLAKRRSVFDKHWSKKWEWEFEKRATSLPYVLDIQTGIEPAGSDPIELEKEIFKFYQNKQSKCGGITFPKRCFFVTTQGENGTLFQPSDPYNLEIRGDELIDPLST